jgi:Activator of Hsp90 ATPase homolog 1-like protein
MGEAERAIFKVFIRGSVDAVWHEITKTDSLQGCMFNMRLVTPGLGPGAPMQMRTKSDRYVGIVGEVLEFDPPRQYSHTFKFTRFDDPPCIVTYELKPVSGGVEFTMTLDNLPPGTKTTKQMMSGGNWIVKALKSVVETGKPALGVRLLYGVFGLLEGTSPARCKVENWPLKVNTKS